MSGSKKDGNDRVKTEAAKVLTEAGHEVLESCEIFRSESSVKKGSSAVDKVVISSNIYYVVCSSNGYVGNATARRLGICAVLPYVRVFSSQEISDPDLRVDVEKVLSPSDLVELLEEEKRLKEIS